MPSLSRWIVFGVVGVFTIRWSWQVFSALPSYLPRAQQLFSETEAVRNTAPKTRPEPTPPIQLTSETNNVAVIGGAGNAGAFITKKLRESGLFESVVPIDMDPHLNEEVLKGIATRHSRDMTRKELSQFETVLFLGGCTGRKSCAALSRSERYQVQVEDLLELAKKMTSDQHLIAASTSAVLEGQMHANEANQILESRLDEYSESMWQREQAMQELVSAEASTTPRITLLRFGTLVGISPAQRADLLVPSLFRTAYTKGVLTLKDSLAHRSFLGLFDLSRAVQTLITSPIPRNKRVGKFSVWNLASFNATILKVATTVASLTEATIDVQDKFHQMDQPTTGFTLDCTKFEQTFNFAFKETLLSVLDLFDQNMPESATPKGPHAALLLEEEKQADDTTIPCPVCGATGQQTVLDLGKQPFANDFLPLPNQALASPRFPLRLVRCRVCHHYHLSHMASREDLFEQYLYRSGTSGTLQEYFAWLAQKITTETGKQAGGGNVLELACNDGSQLDQFRKLGWKTFGVDPAKNIATIAQQKNHTVKNGFWPLDFPELPRGDNLHAIVAQNVLAHVPFPVEFLKACANVMGPKTKLYIQTSQCNMQQLGQFDTMYHEHISFFTGHSFVKAADLSGLYITSFETTPIHGESCLVTLILDPKEGPKKKTSPTMAARLQQEIKDEVTTEFFGEKFKARAHAVRDWVATEVLSFRKQGYIVGAYGAAAKGMTLMHFILDGTQQDGWPPLFNWVLDDAPLKQDRYCPGTVIPVRSTNSISHAYTKQKLVIVVLAWNFLDEIVKKVAKNANGIWKSVFILAPFPVPRMFLVDVKSGEKTLIREMTHNPTPIPNPMRKKDRKKVLMVSHMRNEEMMTPFFILHHAPLCDHAILIDYLSTDRTLELIHLYAPPSWRVVNSTTGGSFDANETDQQVMYWENKHPDDWSIALTVTEFLLYPAIRRDLHQIQQETAGGAAAPRVHNLAVVMAVGDDNKAPLMHYRSLLQQRHLVAFGMGYETGRVLHYGTSQSHEYLPGRHRYKPKKGSNAHGVTFVTQRQTPGFIVKFVHTPFPENVDRLIGVGQAIPKDDVENKRGRHHSSRTSKKSIVEERKRKYAKFLVRNLRDLCDIEADFVKFHQIFWSFPVECPEFHHIVEKSNTTKFNQQLDSVPLWFKQTGGGGGVKRKNRKL